VRYWDVDGANPGPGDPIDGNWDLEALNWSSSAAGDVDTVAWAAGDEAVFSAGATPFDGTFTLFGGLDPAGMTVENGRVILALSGSSATTSLAIGGNPIRVNQGGVLQIPTLSVITPTAGHVLTLDGGTLRNTITGLGSGIYPSPAGAPTRIELTANGGTLDTPNGGEDDISGAYSIMLYGTPTSAAVVGMAPGVTAATLRKTGHGEFRALNNWTFTQLDVEEGLYRINSSGGGETGFGAATGTVRTFGGAVENTTNGSALGTSAALTGANASPATRSFILGGTGDTMIVLNASWTINGPISGVGGLMLNGWARNDGNGAPNIIGGQANILALGGTNTYAGPTTINFGTLATTGGNAIPNASRVAFSTRSDWGTTLTTLNTAILRVDASETVGSLSGGNSVRGVVNINGPAVVLTTGNDATSSTFEGVISGTGSLRKVGAGTFTMSGANAYTGDTRVEGGALSTSTLSLADAADVFLSTGSTFNLNFAGTDVIDSFFIDGVSQAIGTWGAVGSGAANTTPLLTGTGLLQVSTFASANNADFDGDGDVDGADFLTWQRGFGLTGQPNKSTGDANGDGNVNGLDLDIWKTKFGGVPATAAVGAVPEPASMAMAAVALVAGFAAARRRS
jgi:autotransporter-associated beta strand protein